VNKSSTDQFFISEPRKWLNYAKKKHTLKIEQASFNIPWVTCIQAFDFERNLDLKIRGGQQTASGQQTRGGRRPLLPSDFQIEVSFAMGSFYGRVTQN